MASFNKNTLPSSSVKATLQDPNPQTEQIFEVDKILQRGMLNEEIYYLVAWKGYSQEEATWENVANLTGCKDAIREFEEIIAGMEKEKEKEKKLLMKKEQEQNHKRRSSRKAKKIDIQKVGKMEIRDKQNEESRKMDNQSNTSLKANQGFQKTKPCPKRFRKVQNQRNQSYGVSSSKLLENSKTKTNSALIVNKQSKKQTIRVKKAQKQQQKQIKSGSDQLTQLKQPALTEKLPPPPSPKHETKQQESNSSSSKPSAPLSHEQPASMNSFSSQNPLKSVERLQKVLNSEAVLGVGMGMCDEDTDTTVRPRKTQVKMVVQQEGDKNQNKTKQDWEFKGFKNQLKAELNNQIMTQDQPLQQQQPKLIPNVNEKTPLLSSHLANSPLDSNSNDQKKEASTTGLKKTTLIISPHEKILQEEAPVEKLACEQKQTQAQTQTQAQVQEQAHKASSQSIVSSSVMKQNSTFSSTFQINPSPICDSPSKYTRYLICDKLYYQNRNLTLQMLKRNKYNPLEELIGGGSVQFIEIYQSYELLRKVQRNTFTNKRGVMDGGCGDMDGKRFAIEDIISIHDFNDCKKTILLLIKSSYCWILGVWCDGVSMGTLNKGMGIQQDIGEVEKKKPQKNQLKRNGNRNRNEQQYLVEIRRRKQENETINQPLDNKGNGIGTSGRNMRSKRKSLQIQRDGMKTILMPQINRYSIPTNRYSTKIGQLIAENEKIIEEVKQEVTGKKKKSKGKGNDNLIGNFDEKVKEVEENFGYWNVNDIGSSFWDILVERMIKQNQGMMEKLAMGKR